jgi:DNA-binding CsgD family transcriptional regulator
MASRRLRSNLSTLRRVYEDALGGAPRKLDLPREFAHQRVGVLRLRRPEADQSDGAVGRSIFDAIPFPAVVVNDRLQGGLCNLAWKEDRICEALDRQAEEVARGRTDHQLVAAIRRGRRQLLPASATGLGRPALVIPMPSEPFAIGASAVVVLMGARHAAPSQAFAEDIRRLFDLTPAEAAVAGAVLAGRSLAEVAACRGTDVQTIQSQMKSILRKTGASSRQRLTLLLIQGLWSPRSKG